MQYFSSRQEAEKNQVKEGRRSLRTPSLSSSLLFFVHFGHTHKHCIFSASNIKKSDLELSAFFFFLIKKISPKYNKGKSYVHFFPTS